MKNSKSLPLIEYSFEEFNKLKQTADLYHQAIEERLNYLFHTIFENCGSYLQTWWVSGADEGKVGDINKLLRGSNYIHFGQVCCESPKRDYEKFKVILDGKEWDLLSAIPKRWLFENFEDELDKGLESYRTKLKNKKLSAVDKRKANKQLKEKLIVSARSKLTIEEQKAVGIYKK